MWKYIIRLILRYRVANLIVIGLLTIGMAFMATRVQMSYEMARMLPKSDSVSMEYEHFKATFGQDGAVVLAGLTTDSLFTPSAIEKLDQLTMRIKATEGIEEVLSPTRLFNLVKDTVRKQFTLMPLMKRLPQTQAEVDSFRTCLYNLPFYQGLIFSVDGEVALMTITLDKKMLNNRARVALIDSLKSRVETFGHATGVKVSFSGLPYIRTITSRKIEQELKLFVLFSLLITSVILLLLFRSGKAVFFPVIIVFISVIWTMGFISLLGYKITILTGVLPPLIIVIGIENCIFLLNKYHSEYRDHGGKVRALSHVVERIGSANMLTNATTAAGFASFIITGNAMLTEFGLVASLSILTVFLLTLFLIPIFFSFLPNPEVRHTKHLEKGLISGIIRWIVIIVEKRRPVIYLVTFVMVIIGVVGVTRLGTSGKIVDDMPHRDPMYKDLVFLEKHYNGVMPLEISIDTRKKRGVIRADNLARIDKLQQVLAEYPELSKPLSVVEVAKLSRQAFFGGDPLQYSLPTSHERNFILGYMPKNTKKKGGRTIMDAFADSTLQKTRISVQMENVGTDDIDRITESLRPRIDSIFSPDKYDVKITGTSVVFLKGTDYMVNNLFQSLVLAVILISGLMALLFSSWRMIAISLIPNLIPQLLTAALMGYAGIPIKPSTILIFSVALGISVDNTIQFLSRYRLQLRLNDWNIRPSVLKALSETGYSMIYSSSVLFFGFLVFVLSTFGGTEAMGYLISFTLLTALLSNLFLIPSLLLWLDHIVTTRRFREPLLQILDEEFDEEIDSIELETDTRGGA
ncbi:MAG TPA: transporter [Bacteroidales bacterium]|nr:MAG: hypothetical protein A2X11_03275 [Bacteroidetes bacterium GWE2_42_24]OFY32755.1 MAG: hypothetical protein A2X09_06850 [Bacteroidetes bacterium GWF2_43_11]HAQ66021.1 transporter [Bacteroidales bacterium]HBZ65281.1 transporter [Bacteroidales bacterium]